MIITAIALEAKIVFLFEKLEGAVQKALLLSLAEEKAILGQEPFQLFWLVQKTGKGGAWL